MASDSQSHTRRAYSIFPFRFIFEKEYGNHSCRFSIGCRLGREFFFLCVLFSKRKLNPFPPVLNWMLAGPGVFFSFAFYFQKKENANHTHGFPIRGRRGVFFLCVLFFKKENGNRSHLFPIRDRQGVFFLCVLFFKTENGNRSHLFPIRDRRGVFFLCVLFFKKKTVQKEKETLPTDSKS